MIADKEDLIAWLKENMRVSVLLDEDYGYGFNDKRLKVSVKILVNDELVCEDSDYVSVFGETC